MADTIQDLKALRGDDQSQQMMKDLAMSVVLGAIDLPQRFRPVKLDREQWQGGPEDPGAQDRLPIKPIQL